MSKKTEEIRKRIELAEQKRGRELTRKEKRRITKRVEQIYRRRNFIRAALVTLGIGTAGVAGKKLLDAGNNNKVAIEKIQEDEQSQMQNNSFRESLSVSIDEQNTQEEVHEEENKVIEDFLREYNAFYDTELKQGDLGYLKSSPGYLGVNENDRYVYDYKEKTPVEYYIFDKERKNEIGDIYALVANGKIIASLSKVNGEVQNVDTKVIMADGIEYFKSDKYINWLDNKEKEEKEKILEGIESKYQERLKAVESQER